MELGREGMDFLGDFVGLLLGNERVIFFLSFSFSFRSG